MLWLTTAQKADSVKQSPCSCVKHPRPLLPRPSWLSRSFPKTPTSIGAWRSAFYGRYFPGVNRLAVALKCQGYGRRHIDLLQTWPSTANGTPKKNILHRGLPASREKIVHISQAPSIHRFVSKKVIRMKTSILEYWDREALKSTYLSESSDFHKYFTD